MATNEKILTASDIAAILNNGDAVEIVQKLAEKLPDGQTGTLGALIAGYSDLVILLGRLHGRIYAEAAVKLAEQREEREVVSG